MWLTMIELLCKQNSQLFVKLSNVVKSHNFLTSSDIPNTYLISLLVIK